MSGRKRLLLDIALFAAIVAAYYPRYTGIPVHEWLSLAIAAPLLLHLVINWDWVVRVTRAAYDKLRNASRLNYGVDVMLFVSTVTVMLSGFMVSRAIASVLGLGPTPIPIWHTVHSVSADATLALTILHLALHWRWVLRASRRLTSRAVETARRRTALILDR